MPRAAIPRPARPGALLLEDEAKFIDLPRSPLWLNREQVIYAGPEKLDMMRLILGLCAVVLLGEPALAQTYPARPIRLIVGYSPGGGNDLIARIVAAKLQDKLGQPVIVDNKPGAQSIVAAEARRQGAVRRLHAADGAERADDHQSRGLRQAAAIRRSATSRRSRCSPSSRCCWRSAPSSRPRPCSELVEYGRANPKLANYASSATPFQLASELFNQRTGSKFQHIPYRGSGDAVQAVVAGQVLMTIADSGPDGRPAEGRQAAGARPSPRPSATRPFPTCRPWPRPASPTWRSRCGPASWRRSTRRPRS